MKILSKIKRRADGDELPKRGEYVEMDLFDTDRNPLKFPTSSGVGSGTFLDLAQDLDFSTPLALDSTDMTELTTKLWNITVARPSFAIFWIAATGHVEHDGSSGYAGFTLTSELSVVGGGPVDLSIAGETPLAIVSQDIATRINPASVPPNLPYQPAILAPGNTYTVQLSGQKYAASTTAEITALGWGLIVWPDATMVEAP